MWSYLFWWQVVDVVKWCVNLPFLVACSTSGCTKMMCESTCSVGMYWNNVWIYLFWWHVLKCVNLPVPVECSRCTEMMYGSTCSGGMYWNDVWIYLFCWHVVDVLKLCMDLPVLVACTKMLCESTCSGDMWCSRRTEMMCESTCSGDMQQMYWNDVWIYLFWWLVYICVIRWCKALGPSWLKPVMCNTCNVMCNVKLQS